MFCLKYVRRISKMASNDNKLEMSDSHAETLLSAIAGIAEKYEELKDNDEMSAQDKLREFISAAVDSADTTKIDIDEIINKINSVLLMLPRSIQKKIIDEHPD